MVNYRPYHNALNGLSKKYETGFVRSVGPIFELNNPFELSFDEIDGQNRSDAYRYLRDNFDAFQSPYSIAAFELGNAIYSSNRDLAERKSGKVFPAFQKPDLTKELLDDNLIPFWEITGLLKKVYNGNATLNWVAQIGSRGVSDLARASTVAAADNDKKLKKYPVVALQSGACDFCVQMSKNIDHSGVWKKSDASFHSGCRCAIVFEYV